MGGGASKPRPVAPSGPPMRLVLHSEYATALPRFTEMLDENAAAVVREKYDFNNLDLQKLTALLTSLVKEHGPFASVALAPLGPGRPPAPPNEAENEECRWEISDALVLTDPVSLTDASHPVRVALEALGKATVDGGRVDLFTCDLLGTWACPEKKFPKLMPFHGIEETASCRFTASKNMLVGNPLEDDEWPMETDASVDARAYYFVPPPGVFTKLHRSAMRQRYLLGQELGRGNFAAVYRARRRGEGRSYSGMDLSLRRSPSKLNRTPSSGSGLGEGSMRRSSGPPPGAEVAIKAIDKARVASMSEVEAEVAIMSMLKHENILRLYETFDSRRRMYLVLEIATGGELYDRIIERGSYTEADAAVVMHQLFDALAYMHALGVTHADLKPANLLLATPAPNAPLKVADFGLASVLLGPTTHAAQTLVGTPDYMAPELLVSEPPRHSPPIDMWAAGVVLFVLLSGEPPFGGASAGLAELFQRITTADFDHCEGEEWASISTDAKDAVLKLMEPDPNARLTAAAMLVHPWIHYAEGGTSQTLAAAQAALKGHQARQKMQRAVRTILAQRRMQRKAEREAVALLSSRREDSSRSSNTGGSYSEGGMVSRRGLAPGTAPAPSPAKSPASPSRVRKPLEEK